MKIMAWTEKSTGKILLVLVLHLYIDQFVDAHSCSGEAALSLILHKLNRTKFPEAQCVDNSDAGFYYHTIDKGIPKVNRPFIIWLGDTKICSGKDCDDFCGPANQLCSEDGDGTCDNTEINLLKGAGVNESLAKCLYAAAICSSNCWGKYFSKIKAQTILCGDDPVFKNFDRVFIPSCSLDNWIGRGDDSSFGNPLEPRFKGAKIFEAVIETLIEEFNLAAADKVILGGIGGAGAGALNLLPRLKELVDSIPLASGKTREFFTIIDSAWIVDVEKFAPTYEDVAGVSLFPTDQNLRENSSDWIQNALLHPNCRANYSPNKLHRCLYPSELLKYFLYEQDKVLVLQSHYDLILMERLGIADEASVGRFEDIASFSQAAIAYIEHYGDHIRSSLQETSKILQNKSVFFFSSACAQHGYVVPTKNHVINRRKRTIGEGRNTIGHLGFQRTEDVWTDIGQIKAGKKYSVRDIIINFVETDAKYITGQTEIKILTENCGNFLCNNACKTDFTPFALTPLVSVCAQQMIFMYAGFVLFLFFFLFLISMIDIYNFRKLSSTYWEKVRAVESGQNLKRTKSSRSKLKKEAASDIDVDQDEAVDEMELIMKQHNTKISEVQKKIIQKTKSTAAYRSIHLMLENVSYWPKQRYKGAKPPQILNNVNISFEPGKLHALMGPSGSGKSTLMAILALTRDSGTLKGKHYINGVPSHAAKATFLKEWMKQNTSFVAQQDVFYPTLTARQHLEHAAWLMLPQFMPDTAKLQRVWRFIRLMDLSSCADTLCGDGGVYFPGGLSGGQRRRLSVATQLLRNPSLLFLDEPTTGLDSESSLYLLKLLHELANIGGVNIILTIHQPRKEIFKLIDNLCILVRGHLIFAGRPSEAATFFELDLTDDNLNIGDEVLDLLKDINSQKDIASINNIRSKFESTTFAIAQKQSRVKEKTFLTRSLASKIQSILVFNSLAEGRWSWNAPSSASWQQFVLLSRTYTRGGFKIFTSVTLSTISGFVLGYLFYDVDNYKAIIGLLYLIVSTLTFLQGIFLARRYFDEKAMFDHEWSSGTMRSWVAFILSQYARDAVFASFETVAFITPVYCLSGLSSEPSRIATFFVISILTGYCTTCQNVFIQIDRDNISVASTVQIGALAIGALFNGFIVPLGTLPVYFAWIPYICLGFYGFVGVVINELSDFSLPCDSSILECSMKTGDVVIRVLSYDQLDVFICIIALVAMIVFFRAAGAFSFYFRYARKIPISGSSKVPILERMASNSKIRSNSKASTIFNAEENQKGGTTIQNVLERAITPSQMRLQLMMQNEPSTVIPIPSPKLKHNSIASRVADLDTITSRMNDNEAKILDIEVETDHLDMIDTKSLVESSSALDDDKHSNPSYESNEQEDDHAPLSRLQNILLSREVFVLFFLMDVFLTGYICLRFDSVICAVAGFFLFGYFIQFCNHIVNLLPRGIDDARIDFTWAGQLDYMSLILLVIDATLTFQALQLQANGNIESALIVTLIVKIIRILRVQMYWYKVNKLHRIRADALLDVVEFLERKEREKQKGNQKEDQRQPPPNNTKRLSWIEKMENEINQRENDSVGRISKRLRASIRKENRYTDMPKPRRFKRPVIARLLRPSGTTKKRMEDNSSDKHDKAEARKLRHYSLISI